MRICPILVDARPDYLVGHTDLSLLLMPLGGSTVLESLQDELARCTRSRIVVVSRFEPEPPYREALGALGVPLAAILSEAEFLRQLDGYEPSDWLLIRDSRQIGPEALDLRALLDDVDVSLPSARHLVCLAATHAGTSERVLLDGDGRVSRIQRYYEPVTWPFASGVACSLVPNPRSLGLAELPLTSLSGLRASLAAAGVPSRDFPLPTVALDVGTEAGYLAVIERLLASPTSPRPPLPSTAAVDPTATIRGEVRLDRQVTVEAGAVVIGPAVLGAGCRVGSGAVLAQCVVPPGICVPPGTVARQAVVTLRRERYDGPADVVFQGTADLRARVQEPDTGSGPLVAKRVVELLLSVATLLVLAPLLALIALLIKLDSRGPVLFGHRREGLLARPFRCWKFRTMYEGADAAQRELAAANQLDGPQFKIAADPRVTRLGRWLRRFNLDELPQLLNVITGEMSLVGPRPSPFRENQVCIPWREARLSVQPGITGLWQVCRHDRSSGDFHQWIYYDLLYVAHASPWLDLKILVSTVLSLAGRYPVPLSLLLPPATYHDRRRSARPRGDAAGAAHLRRTA